MGHDSQLDELARKGAERQQAETRAQDADGAALKRSLDERHATSRTVAALSLSRLRGLWVASKVAAGVVAAVAVIFGVVCAWSLQEPHPASDLHAYKLGLMACIAGLVVFAALPFVLKPIATASGRAECDATERWLAGLPFAVTGYLDVIGRHTWIAKLGSGTPSLDATTSQRGSSTEWFDVQVELHPVGEPPPVDFMGKLLDGLGNPFSHESYRASPSAFSFNGGPNGAVVANDLRRMIERLLVPLHERYPLRAVRISVERV